MRVLEQHSIVGNGLLDGGWVRERRGEKRRRRGGVEEGGRGRRRKRLGRRV
jgi:hypothetical protein